MPAKQDLGTSKGFFSKFLMSTLATLSFLFRNWESLPQG